MVIQAHAPGRVSPGPAGAPTRTAARWRLAAIGVVWGTTLAIAAVWLAGGGIGDLVSGTAAALQSAGRLFGLAAANLLLYQVLLMARIPVFERGFGRSGITRAHRVAGFGSMLLLGVHIALVCVGYAVAAGVNPLVQAWLFVAGYPGVLLAVAGTGLLVAVALTSRRRPRRRMRYESWHLLHLYGYLGVGLSIPHMLWTGADFSSMPVAAAYWWGLWAVTAGCVLWFRVLAPLGRSAVHGLKVAGVRPDGRDGVVVWMRGRGIRRLRAQAGQFFVWRFLDGPGWSRGHPFSLAAAPRGDNLLIAARVVGDGTRRLARLEPGTRVMFEGPYGTMTGGLRTGSGLLMLGAGAGVVPLVAILESEPYRPGAAVLATRDHHPGRALCALQIARLQQESGVVHVALDGPRAAGSRSWLPGARSGRRGADLIRQWAQQTGDPDGCDVYVCGPPAWMAAVRRDLAAAGIPAARVHAELFGV